MNSSPLGWKPSGLARGEVPCEYCRFLPIDISRKYMFNLLILYEEEEGKAWNKEYKNVRMTLHPYEIHGVCVQSD